MEKRFAGKKIAVLGYGEVGRSAVRYFKKHGAAEIVVHDQAAAAVDPGTKLVSGPKYLQNLDGYDLVFRSPTIFPHLFSTTAPVTSATNEFFERSKAVTIGVTGTKGKGTVSTLIYEMLRSAGKTVWLSGNVSTIELDVIDELQPGDFVVLELSNTRLWDIRYSPQIAVLLPIYPEHMDWHRGDFDEYVATKANITKFQKPEDTLIYHAANETSRKIGEASVAKKLPYPDPSTINIKSDGFYAQDIELCALDAVQIPGHHNQENVAAALLAAWQVVRNASALERAVRAFHGLPHRLQYVADRDGVDYVDDSIGTTPEATMAALEAYSGPKILILGGSDKGADFTGLAKTIKEDHVKAVIVIGETAPKLSQALKSAGYPGEIVEGLTKMPQIVAEAARRAAVGDIVLLSPACASFGLFRNYAERGDQFIASVKALS